MSSASNAILWSRGGRDGGKTYPIGDGLSTIGRAKDNDIVIEHHTVSRRHAEINKDESGYWLSDVGSRNGTFVNGSKVEVDGRRLRDMDRIDLGSSGSSVFWVFREVEGTEDFNESVGGTVRLT